MATHDRLRALVDLARRLSASLDLDDVLRRVAGHATAVTGSSACSVSLWDRERDSLVTLTGWDLRRMRKQLGPVVEKLEKAIEQRSN